MDTDIHVIWNVSKKKETTGVLIDMHRTDWPWKTATAGDIERAAK